jgi:hypothetical protein
MNKLIPTLKASNNGVRSRWSFLLTNFLGYALMMSGKALPFRKTRLRISGCARLFAEKLCFSVGLDRDFAAMPLCGGVASRIAPMTGEAEDHLK